MTGKLEAALRTELRQRHDRVCACPFDGTDDGCNLVLTGAEIGALLAASGQAGPVIGSKTLFHPDGSSSRYELRASGQAGPSESRDG